MHVGVAALSITIAAFRVLAAEQGQQEVANVQCIQRLRLPAYPGIAISARLSGYVTVNISIGHAGAVRDVTLAGKSQPLLANSVMDAVRASMFVSTCQDRSVTLLFRFLIEGKGTDYPTAPVISFGFPNTFWIVSAPRHFQP